MTFKVQFDNVDNYIEEIGCSAECILFGVVRAEIVVKPDGMKQAYSVRSSFVNVDQLCYVMIDCGVSPPRRGEDDGREIAEGLYKKIAQAVHGRKLELRKGFVTT